VLALCSTQRTVLKRAHVRVGSGRLQVKALTPLEISRLGRDPGKSVAEFASESLPSDVLDISPLIEVRPGLSRPADKPRKVALRRQSKDVSVIQGENLAVLVNDTLSQPRS